MARIKYNTSLIKTMALFESLTGTKLKDCIIDRKDVILFVVEQHQIGKAIGKGSEKLRRLKTLLKRKIKIVEFDPEITQFVRNIIYPLQVKDIRLDERTVIIEGTDRQNRALLIGKSRQNLRQYEDIVKRYFQITEIKVV